MDDLITKYLKRLKIYFIIIAVLGYLFMFTVGSMFFVMDVTSKLWQFLLILTIPSLYLVTGLIIRIKNKFVWILAMILSVIPLIHAVPSLIKSLSGFSIIMMLTFNPVIWEILFSILLLTHLLKSEVVKYYF